MYKEKFVQLFKEIINTEELEKSIDKYSFAIGFFMGKGCDFKQADELAKKLKGDPDE
jgi:hypothetical protein